MDRPTDLKRTIVEPAWHAIDERHVRGLRGPITVVQHSHARSQREAEAAIDLMDKMGVDCGEIGFHRHSVPSMDRTAYRDQWPHHHHDLRCLVEAGVQSVRPRMLNLERRLESANNLVRYLRATLDQVREESERVKRLAAARLDEMTRMETFMQTMPAVGPWVDVWAQYQDWCTEQAEEQQDQRDALSLSTEGGT